MCLPRIDEFAPRKQDFSWMKYQPNTGLKNHQNSLLIHGSCFNEYLSTSTLLIIGWSFSEVDTAVGEELKPVLISATLMLLLAQIGGSQQLTASHGLGETEGIHVAEKGPSVECLAREIATPILRWDMWKAGF